MRPFLLFSFSLLSAASASPARADTMYKCVGANGKIAYADMPCPPQARAAAEFAVPAPETQEQSEARLAREKERLRRADAEFRARHAARQRALDYQIGRGNGERGSYVDSPGRRAAPLAPADQSDRVPSRRARVR